MDHLEFTPGGAIRPRNGSRYGRETIEVCGLWRASVISSRHYFADTIHRKLAYLSQAFDDQANPRPILDDIHRLGNESVAHAGMARITFQQGTGWTWTDLEQWLADNP